VREFQDDAGVKWVVFLTARSVARDHHLPEQYREGWLAFESANGEKRRVAPVPPDWESLTERELAALCAQATAPAQRRKAAPPSVAEREEIPDESQPAEALQPQLRELETRLSSALDEVCELRPSAKLDTGELIRVEETLALATEAAKEAVSLRRKLRAARGHGEREVPGFRPRPDDRHA
jgi:hypothetical protein